MKIATVFALPLIALASPALGQATAREGCPPDGTIMVTCFIVVTGNLPTSLAERAESSSRVSTDQTRVEQSLLQVPGLQQFRRSDARSANPTSQGVTLRGLGGNASSRAILVLDDVPQADPFGGCWNTSQIRRCSIANAGQVNFLQSPPHCNLIARYLKA